MTGDYSMSKGKKIQTEKQRDMYNVDSTVSDRTLPNRIVFDRMSIDRRM